MPSFTRRDFLKGTGAGLALSLSHLQWIAPANAFAAEAARKGRTYRAWEDLYRRQWQWDKVQKTTHYVNCWYQSACNWNVYVKNGMVWREEQAAIYQQTNPEVPDYNPRGCNKGACYSERMYDATRIRYPLKRAGKRGEGKWQRVSWDQALTEIADHFLDTLTKEGPAAIQWDGGTQQSFAGPHGMVMDRTAFLLDTPIWDINADSGDDHQGSAVTAGKIAFCSSADDMFYASMILIWGANPFYTQIPNVHFVNEARYNGTKIVAICPDFSPSSIHADVWVPVKVASDAALALALCQVMVSEKLYNAAFLKEQTDQPLLVRDDTRLFLRESDIKQGGAEDLFYAWDLASKSIRQMPKDTLKLAGIDPALEGEYEIETLKGKVKVRPVFELLKKRLDEYTPEKATKFCGTNPELIRTLAREIAKTRALTTVTQANFSKFYHGLEMERAQLLVHVLCGQFGKKGGTYQSFPFLLPDGPAMAALFPPMPIPDGVKAFQQQVGPLFQSLKAKGYTDEMVYYEVGHQFLEKKSFISPVLTFYFHGGFKDLMKDQRKWDPAMKRDLDEYVKLSLDKHWQFADPGITPRILVEEGGNFLRRFRGYPKLIEVFLPKLRLLVDINWRMSNTSRYADYVLPCAGWYERNDVKWVTPLATFLHGGARVVDPFGEAYSDWKIHCLLTKKIQERSVQRGMTTFKDRAGKERRLDGLYHALTFGGTYKEDDEAKVAADMIKVSPNLAGVSWDKLSHNGFARFSHVGNNAISIGNSTDLKPDETITPNTWHTEGKLPWPTLTRRLQFYIDQELFMELGEELPVHKEEHIGGSYPLQLVGGHTRHSIHSSWRDSDLMLRLQRGEPEMYMSVADAKARGIDDNDLVRVYNDLGGFEIRAKVAASCAPGEVIVYHAWEPYQFKGGYSHQAILPSPINPIELAGGYFHLRPMNLYCIPGQSDRGVRVDVEKVGNGASIGLRV